jgi:hypothetical protein
MPRVKKTKTLSSSGPATEPADRLLVTRLKGEESHADTFARKQRDKLAAEQARVTTGASLPSAFDAS